MCVVLQSQIPSLSSSVQQLLRFLQRAVFVVEKLAEVEFEGQVSAQDGGVVFACEVAVPEIRGGVIEEVIAQGFARCSARPVCIIDRQRDEGREANIRAVGAAKGEGFGRVGHGREDCARVQPAAEGEAGLPRGSPFYSSAKARAQFVCQFAWVVACDRGDFIP